MGTDALIDLKCQLWDRVDELAAAHGNPDAPELMRISLLDEQMQKLMLQVYFLMRAADRDGAYDA